MDNRKKEAQLRMERGRGGWTVSQVPPAEQSVTKAPAPTPMPSPMPPSATMMPMPLTTPAEPTKQEARPEARMGKKPAEECGYCITLAMAYVPMQEFTDIYEPEQGLSRGTIFAELDLPFMGKGDCRRE